MGILLSLANPEEGDGESNLSVVSVEHRKRVICALNDLFPERMITDDLALRLYVTCSCP